MATGLIRQTPNESFLTKLENARKDLKERNTQSAAVSHEKKLCGLASHLGLDPGELIAKEWMVFDAKMFKRAVGWLSVWIGGFAAANGTPFLINLNPIGLAIIVFIGLGMFALGMFKCIYPSWYPLHTRHAWLRKMNAQVTTGEG